MPLLPSPDPFSPAAEPFEATVRVDPSAGAGSSRRVWLDPVQGVPLPGEPLPVAERADGPIAALAGQRVRVTGQAEQAGRFRVEHLEVIAPGVGVEPIAVGPEQRLRGRFVHVAGEPGSKMAHGWTAFQAEGGTEYLLLGGPTAERGALVQIAAREVDRSPYVAHMTGRHLWVLDVQPLAAD